MPGMDSFPSSTGREAHMPENRVYYAMAQQYEVVFNNRCSHFGPAGLRCLCEPVMLIMMSRLRNDHHFVSRPWVETVEIGDRELMRLLTHSDGSCALLHSSSLGGESTSDTRVPGIQSEA